MKLLVFLLIVSPMLIAEELQYLICRPDKLIKPSYSSDQNTYIKYFYRINDEDKEEYPSSWPYYGDGKILSGPGIQIDLTETAPTSSKTDPDDIWEFQSWNFFAREHPHAYTQKGFSLDRQTLNLTHASSRYCIGNSSSCYRKVKTKCKIFPRSQYEKNLNKAKINSAKRNKQILEAYEKRLQI